MGLIAKTALRRVSQVSRCNCVKSGSSLIPATALATRGFQSSAPQRTDGVFRELTSMRVRTPWVEALQQQQAESKEPKAPSSKSEVPKERDLTPKHMNDSYHSVVLPLARDPWLLDTYLNSSGHIRLGTIFMDLDALSGVIAYKHTGDAVTTVTASCDRITIHSPLTEICDLQLSGRVTYATGRSSLEITMQVAKAPKEGEEVNDKDVLINCTFTMVSLDPATKKPVNVNPLIVETPEEKRLYALGERNSKIRKERRDTSLLKHTPNDLESDLIHAFWQKQLQYHDPYDGLRQPENVVFMDATRLQTATIMQPQFRNRHQFMIFGGFLLKQTFELAFTAAAAFAHARPTFVSLDPSTFQNPVPVGSILYLTATVVYTDPPLIRAPGEKANADSEYTRVQIRIDSKVRDVEHGFSKPTGQFNYTFTVPKNIRVMPRTYQEFMMYVDARRRAEQVQRTLDDGSGVSPKTAEESLTE
ncbi:Thioesterase/thiol ester dehydrase-isomerase [Cucurbitaria berberidis CBS 394.84]|uniref:Thioesterase/thiol ester dehydrase-isomerase n=1 Tax=Cucurbitaria berberidis CBS 394.84 TaxID=1168544 RepID=A0A9P4LBN7_9PLEO|nr:Thioesterase/thiol ester dehydrase-isomerase [Cucurbitaria berberidis CBS 394.84]KAF1849801.1 Thioesterase/thiol ester dehydrase-isomerase [Cucurbitaria berberidis CBS 394.84]